MDAGDVIDKARGLDSSFSPRRHPQRVCHEFLTRYQKELAGKLERVEPEAITAGIDIDLPLADFDAGQLLETSPASGVAIEWDLLPNGAFSVFDAFGSEYPLHIVPYVQRFSPGVWPFAWIRQKTLFLGGRETEWTGYVSIHVDYTPTAGLIDDDADTLVLPDSAEHVIVLALAAELCRRKPDDCARKSLPQEHATAEQAFLELIESRNRAEVGRTREVFSR